MVCLIVRKRPVTIDGNKSPAPAHSATMQSPKSRRRTLLVMAATMTSCLLAVVPGRTEDEDWADLSSGLLRKNEWNQNDVARSQPIVRGVSAIVPEICEHRIRYGSHARGVRAVQVLMDPILDGMYDVLPDGQIPSSGRQPEPARYFTMDRDLETLTFHSLARAYCCDWHRCNVQRFRQPVRPDPQSGRAR